MRIHEHILIFPLRFDIYELYFLLYQDTSVSFTGVRTVFPSHLGKSQDP